MPLDLGRRRSERIRYAAATDGTAKAEAKKSTSQSAENLNLNGEDEESEKKKIPKASKEKVQSEQKAKGKRGGRQKKEADKKPVGKAPEKRESEKKPKGSGRKKKAPVEVEENGDEIKEKDKEREVGIKEENQEKMTGGEKKITVENATSRPPASSGDLNLSEEDESEEEVEIERPKIEKRSEKQEIPEPEKPVDGKKKAPKRKSTEMSISVNASPSAESPTKSASSASARPKRAAASKRKSYEEKEDIEMMDENEEGRIEGSENESESESVESSDSENAFKPPKRKRMTTKAGAKDRTSTGSKDSGCPSSRVSRTSQPRKRKSKDTEMEETEDEWDMEMEEEEGGTKKKKRQNKRKKSDDSTTSKPSGERKSVGPKVIRKKPDQPWKKAIETAEGKSMSACDERMRLFRNYACRIARGRAKEITYNECLTIVEEYRAKRKAAQQKHKAGASNVIIEQIKERVDEELLQKKEATTAEISESSEDEWEEMEMLHDQGSPIGEELKKKIEVTVEMETGEDEPVEKDWWAVYLRQEVNKAIRESWEDAHKCHILCYFGHLRYLRRVAVEENLLPALLVSQLPSGFINAKLDVKAVKRLVGWFLDSFRPAADDLKFDKPDDLQARMAQLAEMRTYETDRDVAMFLFALFVGLEATARICANALVISRKVGGLDDSFERSPSSNSSKASASKKEQKPRNYSNFWVEFWDREEKRWITIDPNTKSVDESSEIEQNVSQPIRYVFGIDSQGGIREISCRYASNYYTQEFRRQRTEIAWLGAALRAPLIAANQERAQLEDVFFDQQLALKPLPKKMTEYKNHPLYVLEKDLLKFEAIYPPPEKQKPLGEIRGHKVYPRSSVYTLQGELNWLKLTRSIKEGEQPYKMVKARPDFRVPVEEREQKFLGVYGFWQTEPYRTPKVENGRIPCNEYGNVYVYQPPMCPIGGVHLRLNGIVNIARRLGKEAVPAVVGWDFNGWNHPIIDGAVVLEEDADELREEWERIDAEKEAREKEKRLKAVYGNWRRMIRGILRLAYVRKKFGQATRNSEENTQTKENAEKNDRSRDAEDMEAGPSGNKDGGIIDNTVATQKLNFSLERLQKFKK